MSIRTLGPRALTPNQSVLFMYKVATSESGAARRSWASYHLCRFSLLPTCSSSSSSSYSWDLLGSPSHRRLDGEVLGPATQRPDVIPPGPKTRRPGNWDRPTWRSASIGPKILATSWYGPWGGVLRERTISSHQVRKSLSSRTFHWPNLGPWRSPLPWPFKMPRRTSVGVTIALAPARGLVCILGQVNCHSRCLEDQTSSSLPLLSSFWRSGESGLMKARMTMLAIVK